MEINLFEGIGRNNSQSPASSFLLEVKKLLILEQLENILAKMKDTQSELREVVKETLKMKEAGDDIANQVFATMAKVLIVN
jgi:ubiquinone biosynthesis protein COQ9